MTPQVGHPPGIAIEKKPMNQNIAKTLAAVGLALVTGAASAKGCVSGAAVGGVAGHVAGHHGLLGAAAGCAINHHRNAVKERRAAAASAVQPVQAPPASATPAAQK